MSDTGNGSLAAVEQLAQQSAESLRRAAELVAHRRPPNEVTVATPVVGISDSGREGRGPLTAVWAVVGVAAACLAALVYLNQPDQSTPITGSSQVHPLSVYLGGGFSVERWPAALNDLPRSIGGSRLDDVWYGGAIQYGDLSGGVTFKWDQLDRRPILSNSTSRPIEVRPGVVGIESVATGVAYLRFIQWEQGEFVITIEAYSVAEADLKAILNGLRFDPERSQDLGS